MSIQIALMKHVNAQPKLLRVAADFVERSQAIVNVKHRVLESLRHDRPGALLKLKHEVHVLLARLRIQIFWKTKEQNVAQKIENRFFDRRIATLGGRDRALDHL